jgi:hypothetical protein
MTRILFLLFFAFKASIAPAQYIHKYNEVFTGIKMTPAPDGSWLGIETSKEKLTGFNLNTVRFAITIKKWDANHKLIKQQPLFNGANESSMFFQPVKKIGNKYWFIYIEPGKKNDLGNMKAVEIDPVTLAIGSSKLLVAGEEMDLDISLLSPNDLHWDVNLSPDQKSLLVFIASHRPAIFLAAFDTDLKKHWQRKEKLPAGDKNVHSSAIDNNATAYVAYTANKKAYIVSADRSQLSAVQEIKMEDRKAKEIHVAATKNNIIVIGSYMDDWEHVEGVIEGRIDPKTQLPGELKLTMFPETFVKQLYLDTWAYEGKKKYGLKRSFETELIPLEDGSINMVGEFRVNMSTSIIMKNTYAESKYGSIFNIRFTENDPLVFTRIPRLTFLYPLSVNMSNPPQYLLKTSADKLTFYYMDNPKNIVRKLDDNPLETPKTFIYSAATIDAAGKLERRVVTEVYK